MGTINSFGYQNQLNDYFEYLLVAHPGRELQQPLEDLKKSFAIKYNAPIAARTHPHFTFLNFMAKEAMEPTLCRWFQLIAGSSQSFQVTLDKFSGFPSHTIYLQVENATPFQQMAQKFKPVIEFITSSGCPPVKMLTKPHLTIARRLTENIYEKAIAHYAEKPFHGSFMLEELILLRRRHQFDKCETIQIFRFRPASSNILGDAA